MVERLTQRVLLAIACCFALVLVPASTGWTQDLIKKGVQGVKKGTETVVDKTKEGAKAVGKGAKDLVTDSDKSDREKMTPSQTQSTNPSTGTYSTSRSSSGTMSSKSTSSGAKKGMSTAHHRLPRTAGDLPLLALMGMLSLAAAGTLRMLRKVPNR
jgi:hypothetical protein